MVMFRHLISLESGQKWGKAYHTNKFELLLQKKKAPTITAHPPSPPSTTPAPVPFVVIAAAPALVTLLLTVTEAPAVEVPVDVTIADFPLRATAPVLKATGLITLE